MLTIGHSTTNYEPPTESPILNIKNVPPTLALQPFFTFLFFSFLSFSFLFISFFLLLSFCSCHVKSANRPIKATCIHTLQEHTFTYTAPKKQKQIPPKPTLTTPLSPFSPYFAPLSPTFAQIGLPQTCASIYTPTNKIALCACQNL